MIQPQGEQRIVSLWATIRSKSSRIYPRISVIQGRRLPQREESLVRSLCLLTVSPNKVLEHTVVVNLIPMERPKL